MIKILCALVLAMNVVLATGNYVGGNTASFSYGFELVAAGFFVSALIFQETE